MSVSIRKNDDELDPKDTLAASPEGNPAPMQDENLTEENLADLADDPEADTIVEAATETTDEVTEPGTKEPEQEL